VKNSKAMAIGSSIVAAALWAIPLKRAAFFYHDALAYFSETASTNALTDLHLAGTLLLAYVLSLLVTVTFFWLFFRRLRPLSRLPLSFLVFIVVGIIAINPECPITLFAPFPPCLPLYGTIAVLLLTLLVHYGTGLVERRSEQAGWLRN
jgi:hypothetical protein